MCTYIYDYIDIKTNILILYIKTFFFNPKVWLFLSDFKRNSKYFCEPLQVLWALGTVSTVLNE